MTNQQFDPSKDPYWYPQLPDGYSNPPSNRHHQSGPRPSPNHHQHQQNWSPGVSPGGHGGMGWFSPPFGGHHSPQPSWPGGGFPGNQQPNMNQPPQSPPPSWTPEYQNIQTFAIDPGAISGCLYRFTYVWLSRRQGFWFYPVFVGRTSIAGYRWNSRRHRWEYIGLDLKQINSFTCI